MRSICAGLRLAVIPAAILGAGFHPTPAAFEVPPRPNGAIHDGARVIRPDDARAIEAISRFLWDRARVGLVVATVADLGGEPIEEVAIRVAKSWGAGGEKEDRGILVLAAIAERRVRIEVGHGAEGFIPDGLAGEIMDRQMIPRFRQGDYSSGIRAASERIAVLTAAEFGFSLDGIEVSPEARGGAGRGMGRLLGPLVLVLLIILGLRNPWLLLFLFMSGRRGGSHRGGLGGGGFGGGRMGGGFGGFGGGSFGGGGASRGW